MLIRAPFIQTSLTSVVFWKKILIRLFTSSSHPKIPFKEGHPAIWMEWRWCVVKNSEEEEVASPPFGPPLELATTSGWIHHAIPHLEPLLHLQTCQTASYPVPASPSHQQRSKSNQIFIFFLEMVSCCSFPWWRWRTVIWGRSGRRPHEDLVVHGEGPWTIHGVTQPRAWPLRWHPCEGLQRGLEGSVSFLVPQKKSSLQEFAHL